MNTAIRNATPPEQIDAAAGDPAQAPWSTLESLVAALIDEVRNFAWMYASAHSKTSPQKPEPIRRPGGGKRRGRKLMRMSDVRALDPRLKNMSDNEIRKLLGDSRVEGESA